MNIGNKIICKDDYRSENLFLGEAYVVQDVNEYGNIQVSNESGEILPHFYRPHRFELIESVDAEAEFVFDSSKQYQTRSGCKFHFIGFGQDAIYPVVGQFISECGDIVTKSWSLRGLDFFSSDLDLIEVPDVIKISVGGVKVAVYDDFSILFGDSATEPASRQEIKSLISALETFLDR